MAEIGRTLADKLTEPQAVEDMERFCAAYRWPRDSYDLPGLIERAEATYRVNGAGLKLVSQAGAMGWSRRARARRWRSPPQSSHRSPGSWSVSTLPSKSLRQRFQQRVRQSLIACWLICVGWR